MNIIEQKLKAMLAYNGVSQRELSRRIGQTPANLNQKVKRGTLTYEELAQIAESCGCQWKAVFIMPDGKEI